jgi:hypothetical protein
MGTQLKRAQEVMTEELKILTQSQTKAQESLHYAYIY